MTHQPTTPAQAALQARYAPIGISSDLFFLTEWTPKARKVTTGYGLDKLPILRDGFRAMAERLTDDQAEILRALDLLHADLAADPATGSLHMERGHQPRWLGDWPPPRDAVGAAATQTPLEPAVESAETNHAS